VGGRSEDLYLRAFGRREMLDYYTGYSCIAVSGKVLFKSESQVKSLFSTLEWSSLSRHTRAGQPLLVMTRKLNISQISNGSLPTVVLSLLLLLVPAASLVRNQVSVKI